MQGACGVKISVEIFRGSWKAVFVMPKWICYRFPCIVMEHPYDLVLPIHIMEIELDVLINNS